jgi:uncharacterized membrane protein
VETDDADEQVGASESDPPSADVTSLPAIPEPLREALNQPGVPPELVQMTVAAFASSSYSGPLPPADQLLAYEKVLPGSADRLLRMAERQQEHRHELERMTVREATNRSWWGLRLGFIITIAVIGVAAAAIFTGRSLIGFGLVLADLAALAGVFAYGRSEQRKERVEKNRQTDTRPSLSEARPTDNEH